MHVRHESGVDLVVAAIEDMIGCFGCLNLYGTAGSASAKFTDTFSAFKAQLVAFTDYLRTGKPPFAFDQTVELMKIIIAAARSREQAGRTVELSGDSRLAAFTSVPLEPCLTFQEMGASAARIFYPRC